ncbi:acyltransferase family protein [Leucobacter sp. HY1910]
MHEIDGVRGIALSLVVLFHIFGNGRVSGGVDVFLVISAYFLTRKLLGHFGGSVHEADAPRKRDWLRHHFLRVSSRLVPSAVIVLLGALAAAWLWSPATQLLQTLKEILASALYYENWELITSQLAYEAAGPQTSPVQHFWSLSVQGQFFLVWPFFALALFLVVRRFGRAAFRPVFLMSTVIFTAASFVWAVQLVSADQQVAYFNTFTRFWELGAGALAAFIPATFMAWPWVRETATWLGLGMIVLSGFVIDGGSLFPGAAALWPVGAAILVLFGASRAVPAGKAAEVMSIAPVRFVARIAYQLYLWHWVILVFYLQIQGYESLGWKGAAVVLGLSTLLAVLTERATTLLTTRSLRHWNWRMAVTIPLVPLLVLSAVALAGVHSLQRQQDIELAAAHTSDGYVGALAFSAQEDVPKLEPKPAPSAAYVDRPEIYRIGADCMQTVGNKPGSGEVLSCDLDDYRTGEDDSSKTVVMTGGSHVVQWYPAMKKIAQAQHWRLVVIDKNGCKLTSEAEQSSCAEWNSNAIDVIASYHPDLVFTLGSATEINEKDRILPGAVSAWGQLATKGIPVVGIRDTPRLPFKVPECVASNGINSTNCRYPREDIYSDNLEADYPGELPENFTLLDITDAVVRESSFVPIIGNVLVYRDHSHLTATYAATTTQILENGLRNVAPSVFDY